jgi:thiazole tautomerase (transcriptional regulator TenI)
MGLSLVASPSGVVVGLLDWARRPADWRERVRAAAAELDAVVVRAKGEPARVQFEIVEQLAGVPCSLLLADRVDVAMAAGIDGVHLPEDGLWPRDVRRLWPDAWISRAIHGLPVPEAEDGADWLVYGHLFPTRSKPGLAPRGLEEAARVACRAAKPVLGIGGVTTETVGRVRGTGLAGVVAADGLWLAPDPAAAARAMRHALGGQEGR